MPQGTYQQIALTADIALSWLSSLGSAPYALDRNDVTASAGPFDIAMPDATQVYPGYSVIFSNISVNSFNLVAFDGSTSIAAITTGQIIQVTLTGNTDSNGTWDISPFGSGTTAITSFTAQSTDSSVTITNGVITAPGGTINFQLPTSLQNFYALASKGFPAITSTAPLTFVSRSLTAGTNITLTNGDGVAAAPVISIADTVTGLTSITSGDITISGNIIAQSVANTDLKVTTIGTGDINLNGVTIDTIGSIAVTGNLTVTGILSSPLVPRVYGAFNDTPLGSGNIITAIDGSSNVVSITGSNGTYEITWTPAFSTNDYGVVISCGTNGGSTPFVSHGYVVASSKTATTMTIVVVDGSGIPVTFMPYGVTFIIMQS